MSGDNISKIDVIKDAVLKAEKKNNCKYDCIIDLDVSSPLRTLQNLYKSFNKFKKFNKGNMFTVTPASKNPYFNMVEVERNKVKIVKNQKKYYSRQKAPKVFSMNASIYIWKKKILFSKNPLFNNQTGIYVMPKKGLLILMILLILKL